MMLPGSMSSATCTLMKLASTNSVTVPSGPRCCNVCALKLLCNCSELAEARWRCDSCVLIGRSEEIWEEFLDRFRGA